MYVCGAICRPPPPLSACFLQLLDSGSCQSAARGPLDGAMKRSQASFGHLCHRRYVRCTSVIFTEFCMCNGYMSRIASSISERHRFELLSGQIQAIAAPCSVGQEGTAYPNFKTCTSAESNEFLTLGPAGSHWTSRSEETLEWNDMLGP